MKILMVALYLAGGMAASQAAAAAGDPDRGAKLHQDCVGCHGAELYVAPRAKEQSFTSLKKNGALK